MRSANLRGYPTSPCGIPWRDIIGMRNIIAQEYGRVDLDELWKTAERAAPRLVSTLEAIVAALPPPRR
jgi:uncharacterized protein with HEPN domain